MIGDFQTSDALPILQGRMIDTRNM
jgi:hypothetical protein